MTKLHDEARKLLPIIVSAAASHQYLTYQTAAQKLGRPKNHARLVAQVCDLLDAAAAFADVPLLALITVLEADHRINRRAWTADDVEPWIREGIIKRSQHHTFTQADFDAIAEALEKLEGKSNRAAWTYLGTLMPSRERRLRLAGVGQRHIQTQSTILERTARLVCHMRVNAMLVTTRYAKRLNSALPASVNTAVRWGSNATMGRRT